MKQSIAAAAATAAATTTTTTTKTIINQGREIWVMQKIYTSHM